MLLRRLVEFNERPDPTREAPLPSLYAAAPIRYVIDLDVSGVVQAMTDTADPSNAATRRGVRHPAPQVQRAVAIRPLLFADKADYTLGVGGPEANPARVIACHAAYRDLVERCAAATGEPSVQAVRSFLDRNLESQRSLPAGFDPGALITFRVDGVFPIDLRSVQRFWAEVNDPSLAGAPVMQCVVCGRERPVLERLQGKLKGIPGGQTSGTSLISANAPAFESYGQPASLVAPTCSGCGEGFTRALNRLLSDEKSRIVLGDSIFVFWTREPLAFSIRDVVMNPTPELITTALDSVITGGRRPRVDADPFNGVALSASGGRAVVRDWLDSTVPEVVQSLDQWFGRQSIVDAFGGQPRPLGLFALAAATVREPRTDLSPLVPRQLLRSALTGAPLPPGLLYQTVRRNRIEQSVDRPRAALIKAALTHSDDAKGDLMVHLASNHPSPAYQCGRLLAVLEEVQRAALPGVKAGIVDRFYGTASSAPMTVFPRLLRGARPHLARLERDRPIWWMALERRLEDIQGRLTDYPRVLSLEEQGLFALGYYHQRASDRADAHAASERRRAGESADPTINAQTEKGN